MGLKKLMQSNIVAAGLAIFSMLFGAGNLMYPINVGRMAGGNLFAAISGFMITAVLLPIVGLVGVILFNGNYKSFFNRLGKKPGFLLILFCMIIIGPLTVMPRIVGLSYTMVSPFIPGLSLIMFSIIFLGITFIAALKESRIISLLGYIISPLLLISLSIIIVKGIYNAKFIIQENVSALKVFFRQLKYGYLTLDLLGTIFFSSIILTGIKKSSDKNLSNKKAALIGLKSGFLGTSLLGIIYVGLSFLGVLHGNNLGSINEAQLFSAISLKILDKYGAAVVSTAVLMACLSTVIALAAVVSKYLKEEIFRNNIKYVQALISVLAITVVSSCLGLTKIMEISVPIIKIVYPTIIALSILNILYKLFNFKPIKIIVLITTIISFAGYLL